MTDEHIEDLLRRAGPVPRDPEPAVWESISGAVRRGDPGEHDRADLHSPAAVELRPAGHPRTTRRWPSLAAAAAAGAVLTWGALELTGADGDAEPDTQTVVAQAELSSLSEPAQPEGSARVVTVEGHQALEVDLTQAPARGDGYLEVWLLKPDVSGMVTIGVLDGSTGQFALPAGVDLADYPVVDISREKLDGDPTHGGDSLIRGQLSTSR